VIDLSRTLFLLISKSGTTPEAIITYLYFRKKVTDSALKPADHFVFVTDIQSGALSEIIQKEKIKCFPHPANVGGRFSVLSVVGLLPACLVGIDIRKLLASARLMRDSFFSEDFSANLPYQLAAAQYLLYKKGKCINTIMPYSAKLERFGDWLMQLLAESTGKAKNNYGEIINVGITPTKALGTTDQHIQTQLFNEGPNNRLIMIIEAKEQKPDLIIPPAHPEIEAFTIYQNVDMKKIFDIEREANVEVFTKNNRPNLTITIDRVDESALGELFFLFEGATAFLGEFFEINVFDQPGVELSKVLTKEALTKLNSL
jgi:glucose-6-phosphate isomerase